MPTTHAPQHSRIDLAALAVAVLMSVTLLVMLGRVAQLQTRPGVALVDHMDERVSVAREPGVRGDLQDQRGRLLAASRFGYRVFIDPLRFPTPPDEEVRKLADATGQPFEKLARAILPVLAENERRLAVAQGAAPAVPPKEFSLKRMIFGGGGGGGAPAVRTPPIEAVAVGPLTPEADPARAAGPQRYLPVTGVLEDWRAEAVRALKIKGVYLELRPVRETPASDVAAALVGKVGSEGKGLLGAEYTLDALMQPRAGRLSYVRDASSRPMWVEEGGYTAPERGADVRLSIDLEVQRIATEELMRGIADAEAAGGRAVVLDPYTGEVLAMVDLVRVPADAVPFNWDAPANEARRPRCITIRGGTDKTLGTVLGRNRCVEDVYEPGSTFKPFMWSATTELGLADPDEIVNTENGVWVTPYGRTIKDVHRGAQMTWAEVLVNSSNIGMAKTTRRMSDQQMRDAVLRFGFGKRTNLGPPGESPGIVTSMKGWSKYTQTSVAMGHEVAVTPLQMVHAFSCFARDGDLAGTMPPVRLTAAGSGGSEGGAGSAPATRVLSPRTAVLTRETMRGVAHNLDMKLERDKNDPPPRYDLFGKSGTAEIPLGKPPAGKKRPKGSKGYFPNQYNASFIAGGPSESPRLVTLVVIDDPGPDRIAKRAHYGLPAAGPVVRRIMERSLSYLGVAPSPGMEGGEVAEAGAPAKAKSAVAAERRMGKAG